MCKGNCKCKTETNKAPCGEWENCDGCNVMDNPLLFLGQCGIGFLAVLFAVSLLLL